MCNWKVYSLIFAKRASFTHFVLVISVNLRLKRHGLQRIYLILTNFACFLEIVLPEVKSPDAYYVTISKDFAIIHNAFAERTFILQLLYDFVYIFATVLPFQSYCVLAGSLRKNIPLKFIFLWDFHWWDYCGSFTQRTSQRLSL